MRITIILVAPARAENIGAAARAMKTMGFSDLRIVDSQAHLEPATRWVAHGKYIKKTKSPASNKEGAH